MERDGEAVELHLGREGPLASVEVVGDIMPVTLVDGKALADRVGVEAVAAGVGAAIRPVRAAVLLGDRHVPGSDELIFAVLQVDPQLFGRRVQANVYIEVVRARPVEPGRDVHVRADGGLVVVLGQEIGVDADAEHLIIVESHVI